MKTYGRACHTALAYAMNDEFSRVLSQQMDYYSNDPNADRVNRIRGEMSQVDSLFFFAFSYSRAHLQFLYLLLRLVNVV